MKNRLGLTLGVIFLFVGAYVVGQRTLGFSGPGPVLLLLGFILLALSAFRGFSGPLLPGGILTGLGAALELEPSLEGVMPGWGVVALGLGLGFLFVAAVDAARKRHRRPSPLPPGIALTCLAVLSLALARLPRDWMLDLHLSRVWPWAILLAGAILIVRSLLASK
jgi:hypothetical protein